MIRRSLVLSPTATERSFFTGHNGVAHRLRLRLRQRVAIVAVSTLIVVAVALPAAPAAADSVVACGDVTSPSGLVASIDRGNRYRGGTVTIQLAAGCTYVIPEAAWDYDTQGNKIYTDSAFWKLNNTSGFTNTLIIEGNGATITRASSAARIRFFDIGDLADVEIKNLTITGGLAPHGRPDGYQHTSSPGQDGGAILNAGRLTLDNVTITGNSSGNGENGDNGGSGNGDSGGEGGRGGGIFNSGTLTISGSTVTGNVTGAGGSGGNGLVNGGQGGSGGRGGGIYNTGTLSITTSTISSNSTGSAGSAGSGIYGGPSGYRGAGGGIAGSGNITITRSLVDSNNTEGTMAAEGGAIDLHQGGNLVIENSTFLANKAWRGGALHLSGGSAIIRSSTFTDNAATGTGDQISGDVAAMDRGATMTFANTLLAGNQPGGVDCNTEVFGPAVSYTSLGGLVSDESSGCGTNTVITDAKLATIGAWGGPTQSRLPALDSPVLGAGVAAYCLPADQRGVSRPSTACDVGAVERVAAPSPGVITGPVVVPIGQVANYAASSSAGGPPLEYRWGVTGVPSSIDSSAKASPAVAFTTSGVATVNLNVRVAGTSDSESVNLSGLTVKVPPAGNTPPQLSWTGTPVTSVDEGDVARFSFSVLEPDGESWSLSSGSPSCGAGGVVIGSQLQAGGGYVDCSFPDGPTNSVVTVKVEDSWAASTSISTTVAVAEVPSTITVTGSPTADEGSVANFAFTIHEAGSDTFIPVATCAGPGVSKVSGSDHYLGGGHDTSGSFQCRLGNGPNMAEATVTANGGSGTFSVAVENVAPSINVSGPNPASENGSTNTVYRYELNAVDPGDKANLTVVPSSPSCGGPGIGIVVSYDVLAVVCRFLGGPNSAFVTATVQDQDGATSSGGGLSVQINNVAPTVTVGQPTGPVAEGSFVYFTVAASDPGLDTLTVVAPPDCTVSYLDTATPGFLSAVLACRFLDGPATVSRTVGVNDGTSSGYATIANQQVTDAEPSIDAAFTSWDSWEGGDATIHVGDITDPGQDTVTSLIVHWGDGSSENHSWPLSSPNLVHAYGASGLFVATIDLIDEDGTHLSSAGELAVTVHNIAPSLHVSVPSELSEGVPVTITYAVGIGSSETYSISDLSCGLDALSQTISATDVVADAHGGSFVCSWPVGNRDQEIWLRVTDSGGLSNETKTPVYVKNEPAVVTWTSGDAVVYENATTVHRFDFHANDNGPFGLTSLKFSMAGGQRVMFGCGDGGHVVSLADGSPGVVFDAGTGDGYVECTFPRGPAVEKVQVDISDWQSETVSVFPVTVVNAAPAVTLTAPTGTVVEGGPALFHYTTSDPSNEPVLPTIIDCGPHGTLDSQGTGTFTCLFDDGPADFTASITVSDGVDTATDSALVHVDNAPPTSLTLGGSEFFIPGVPYELILGATTDAGDDTVNTWTISWGDGSTSIVTAQTPNPTHIYTDEEPRTITVDVTDEDGSYPALGTKSVVLADLVPPVLSVPDDVTMEANGTDGLYWPWPRSALDARDGELPVLCTGPGMYGYNFFPIGSTRYDCWAVDAAGNRSDASFTVTVVDTTAPVFPPVTLGQVSATSPAGAIVDWDATATDLVNWRIGGTCNLVPGQLFAFGTYAVHCTATDIAGNTGVLDFSFEVGDFSGPVITAAITELDVSATGPDGAVANFATPTAWDAIDGAVPVSCLPASGSVFPLGDTSSTCSATDGAGNASTLAVLVRVADTSAPEIVPPADILAAPTGPTGAVVAFASPTGTDAVDLDVAVTCAPASGSLFPLGVTTVDCSASDGAGNTGFVSFTITVQDTQAPVVTPPADLTIEAVNATGQIVSYTGESAFDVVEGALPATCAPASGALFAFGLTTVTCTATDSESNVGTADFTVTIVDTEGPTVPVLPPLTMEAGAAPTTVTFAEPTASDTVDGAVSTSCAPASGSVFGMGDTTVTCTAGDAHGNTGRSAFTVSVVDTTPPSVSGIDVTVGATSSSGAAANFVATATDLVDGALTPSCTPASGSVFAAETTTTVTCIATDLHGNTGTGSLTVTVHGAVTTQDVAAGDTEVEVSLNLFAPGDYVVIDQGGAHQEVRFIEALGSIIFAAPVAHPHPAGSMVSVIAPPPLGDTTAPTIVGADLGNLVKGSKVTANIVCTDGGVGVEVCEVPAIDTSAPGTYTLRVRAWDFNGNLSSQSFNYTVVVAGAQLGATGVGGVERTMLWAVLLILGGAAMLATRRRTPMFGSLLPRKARI